MPRQPPIVKVEASSLDRYVGAYRTPRGSIVRILMRKGRHWWQSPRGGLFELFPEGPDRFFLKAADYDLTFVLDGGTVASRIDIRSGDEVVPFTRERDAR